MSINNPKVVNINLLEYFITEKCIKFYEYSDFINEQQIGRGSFGNVVRVNYKTTGNFFALKSLNNNEITLKEVVNEVQYNV